jgi:methyltransferase (TIGR00027 family)
MSSGSSAELSAVHRTAFNAAAMRAAHSICGAEPKIFDDNYALPLTDMTEAEVIAFSARVPVGAASTPVIRSRYTEERLAAAKERLNQYVVLGAGLDSYALRMRDNLGSLVIFEVDDPPFQAWKQRRIEALGETLPEQVRYVPCDFESMSISEALAAGGFDDSAPCFISWLGVTQYLTHDAIMETVRWAAQRPAGSEIVLSFVEYDAVADDARMARNVATFHSHFSVGDMTQLLQDAGFSRVEHLSLTVAEEALFKARSDGLTAPQLQRVVSAIV